MSKRQMFEVTCDRCKESVVEKESDGEFVTNFLLPWHAEKMRSPDKPRVVDLCKPCGRKFEILILDFLKGDGQ